MKNFFLASQEEDEKPIGSDQELEEHKCDDDIELTFEVNERSTFEKTGRISWQTNVDMEQPLDILTVQKTTLKVAHCQQF